MLDLSEAILLSTGHRMKTLSTMLALGTIAPSFSLKDVVSGKDVSLSDNKNAQATLIMFICNHCPYVKLINHELTRLGNDYMPRGVTILAINSNDYVQYPDDSPKNMQQTATREAYPFPYLIDETQDVAKAYQAACTPDFFLFDDQLSLVYRGQLDDARPGNGVVVTGSSLRMALECVLSNKPVIVEQKPSMGCNIKWRQNNQ